MDTTALLLDHLWQVSLDRPDLHFGFWLPLAENRLAKSLNLSN